MLTIKLKDVFLNPILHTEYTYSFNLLSGAYSEIRSQGGKNNFRAQLEI